MNQQGAPAPRTTPTGQQNGEHTADRGGSDASDRIALNKEQKGSISSVIRERNIQPVKDLDIPLTVGTRVPDSVPLVPVPDEIVAELPQFLNYSFFVDEQQELVILDPATRQIKALVPISGDTTVEVRSRTEGKRAGGNPRSSETERVGASARPDTERSIGATSSRSTPPARKRMTREVEQGDESTGDTSRKNLTQTDRQQRSTIQNRSERRKTVRAETDVTVGSAAHEQGDESTGDTSRRNLTQTDRQQRSTIQNRSERRKTVRTETDVTAGSAAPQTGDESTGDISRKNLTQTDRQQRSTIQNRSERRRTVRAEPDVTVGSAEPETVEIERDRPVLPPPVRQYRRVEREDGGPVQTRPVDRGPFGLFGLFDIFR